MTRQLALPIQSEIAQEFTRPVELYEVALDTGTLRFAQTNDYIFFASNTYTPLPIRRSPVRTDMELQVDQLTVELENIDLAFSQRVVATEFVGKFLTIKKVFLDQLDDATAFTVLFDGKMDEPVIDERKFAVKVRSILDALHHSLPRRVFGTLCNYQHYDAFCTVSRIVGTNLVTGTVLGSGSTDAILVSSALGVNSDSYWGPIGTVKMQTGSNATLGREILTHTQSGDIAGSITVRVPFGFALNSGEVFEVTRGCRKYASDCMSKYDNYLNYGGYPVTPRHPVI